ncbi:UNVERIFIED_CONTAM: hypothetical protein NCL1_38768, partial [Trichonephila clavipes]
EIEAEIFFRSVLYLITYLGYCKADSVSEILDKRFRNRQLATAVAIKSLKRERDKTRSVG